MLMIYAIAVIASSAVTLAYCAIRDARAAARAADERAARIARKWATRPSDWRDGFGSASHHDRAGEN